MGRDLHDQCFKAAAQSLELVREMLRAFLPEAVQTGMDFATLKVEDKLTVDNNLFLHETDALYSITCAGYKKPIFILNEHKKSIGLGAVAQLHWYMMLLRDREQKYRKAGGKPIGEPVAGYVLVLYHGVNRCDHSMKLEASASENIISRRMFLEGPQLIDVKRVLTGRLRQFPLLRLWLLILKLVDYKDFAKHLHKLRPLIVKLQPGHTKLVNHLLQYAVIVSPQRGGTAKEIKKIGAELVEQQNGDSNMMTVGEALIYEGYDKGMVEG